MSKSGETAASGAALDRLLGYLDSDPANRALLADSAAAALDDRQPEVALGLLDRYEAISPLPPKLLNLKGVAALAEGRFEDAALVFQALLANAPADPALRFNLAWARFMIGNHQGAADLIDAEVVAVAPRAAAMKVQALHALGNPEAAVAWGAPFAEANGDDADLMSALSVAALDNEDVEMARAYAGKAGATHEGLSTLGMLALADHSVADSEALFDRALEAYPESARALLGKGLALMLKDDQAAAAKAIDRGAEIFVDHLGSWVTAGWAYFAQGDYATARERFNKALALDDTFAETHGALAVMDIVQGDLDSARQRTDIALRLDRQCLSAALAKSLLLGAEGRPELGERVRQIALNQPVGTSGQTIAQAMASLGMTTPRRPGR